MNPERLEVTQFHLQNLFSALPKFFSEMVFLSFLNKKFELKLTGFRDFELLELILRIHWNSNDWLEINIFTPIKKIMQA